MPLSSWWDWLAEAPRKTMAVRVLQGAIGTMLLFRVFTELPFALYLWGPNGIGHGTTREFLGPALGTLADLPFASELGTVFVLLVLGGAALGLLVGWQTLISTAVAIGAFFLLDNRLPELYDSGDTAMRLTLLYLLLVLPTGASAPRGSMLVWLHNVGVLAIAMQTMILYATSGLMKAAGQEWYEGTALYYISQLESLSLPAFRELAKEPLATTMGTYFTVLYEVLFPVAVLSPLRRTWIALGAALHLAIAISLGLITFSIIMIGLDLFFITDAEYVCLWGWGRRAQSRVGSALGWVTARLKSRGGTVSQ